MEYLMTYGWAILIVIVISAVLVYYGLFKPPVGKSLSGFGSIMPLDMDYSAAGIMKLYVENRAGDVVNVTRVDVTVGPTTTTLTSASYLPPTSPTTGVSMAAGTRLWLTGTNAADATNTLGDPYSVTVAIYYIRAGQTLSSTGTVTGARS